ncbi:hypothetical protein P7C71_g1023, partial [Lecanoromycetidae sp. Uapishka_2]
MTSFPRQTKNAEVTNSNIDDQWRMMDDQDWPSQLVSSMEHEGHKDENQRDCMKEGTNHNGSPTTTHHQSSQPVPIKILTRPVSSHEDPAAGFSFGKADRAKNFDFRLKQQQHSAIHVNSNPQPSGQTITDASFHESPEATSDVAGTDSGAANARSKQVSSSKQQNASITVLAVPFPNVEHAPYRELKHPTQEASIAPTAQELPSPRTLTNDVTMSEDDTLVGQQVPEMNAACEQHAVDSVYNKTLQQPFIPDHNVRDTGNSLQPSETSHRNHTTKTSQAPQPTSIAPAKVTKSRLKRPIAGSNSKGNTRAAIPPIPYDEEDLLKYFTLKYKHGLHDRQQLEAAYVAKNAELKDLREVSSGLYTQVQDMDHQIQDMERRHNETENRLSMMTAAKPRWESKVKRLNDFLKGLSNDHNRLRDSSKDLRERQVSVLKEKEVLIEALREVHRNTEDQFVKSKQLVTEARHDLKLLGQTVQHQRSELHCKQTLISAEKERSSHVEEQISKLAASHGQIIELLSGRRDTFTSQLDELLNKAKTFQAVVPLESQEHLRPMMEQCVKLLHNLQGSDTIKPDDFAAFKSSMRGYFDDITRSIEACEHSTTVTEAGHQELTILMKNQLQKLSDNIMTEHRLSEQVLDLREMKATLRERVSAADNALANARLQIVDLQRKDQEHIHKIKHLEGSLAKERPPWDSHLNMLRLQELDARNKELEREVAGTRSEATSLANQVEKNFVEIEDLRTRMADTQSQLEGARHEIEAVREEKVACERQAAEHLEQLRKDMADSAAQELANLRRERSKRSPAAEKLSQVTRQFIITAFAERLRNRVAELEAQVQAQDVALMEVRGDLDAANADNTSKDGYIQILQASQVNIQVQNEALKARSRQSASPSIPRRPQNSERPSAVIEDSQPASNTVVVPAKLLSDPFMGNEDPNVSEADLQSLFPGTPLTQKKTFTADPRPSISRGKIPSPQVDDPRKEQYKPISRQILSRPQSKGSDASRKPNRPAIRLQRPEPNMPRGILKDPRGGKRPAAAAGLVPSGMTAPKRQKSLTAGLGPVIADSQSPDRLLLASSLLVFTGFASNVPYLRLSFSTTSLLFKEKDLLFHWQSVSQHDGNLPFDIVSAAPILISPSTQKDVSELLFNQHTLVRSKKDKLPYMPPATVAFYDTIFAYYGLPNRSFEHVCTQCFLHAPISKQQSKHPLLVFSPGGGASRLFYTTILEELARLGYVVAAIDHTYDALIVEFPDGHVVKGGFENTGKPPRELLVRTRAQDVSFVIDELSKARTDHPFELNTSHVITFGHSFGGATAAEAAFNDSRIRGAVNIDGPLFGSLEKPNTILSKPVLQFQSEEAMEKPPWDWDKDWQKLSGWKLQLLLKGAQHTTFTDLPLVFEVLKLREKWGREGREILGTVDGLRGLKIMVAYVSAFVDQVLMGKNSSLLDGSGDGRFPEVKVTRKQ